MNFPENHLDKMTGLCGISQGPEADAWIKDMILYEVYVRSISKEGTFQGLINKLDYIKDLGANTIWLMPIHPIGELLRKGTLGCPYSIMDYMDVNPEYGSKEDFRALVNEVHKRDMKIIIDLVANHSSNDNSHILNNPQWFYQDQEGASTRRFIDWSDVTDINYNSKELCQYMRQVMLYWVKEFDIDGYRCDVAGMVPLEFWEEVTAQLKEIKPQIFMLAEWESPYLCMKAFNSDYHLALYNHLIKIKKGRGYAADLVQLIAAKRFLYPKNYLPMNFIENHDQKRASKVLGRKGFKPSAALIMTIPGIPLIYNGQEIGETEYLSLFDKEDINWSNADEDTLNFYKELIKLRHENEVFRRGEVIPLVNDNPEQTASYMVKSSKDSIGVFLNFSKDSASFNVFMPRYLNYQPGGVIYVDPQEHGMVYLGEENLIVNLNPYGILMVRCKNYEIS